MPMMLKSIVNLVSVCASRTPLNKRSEAWPSLNGPRRVEDFGGGFVNPRSPRGLSLCSVMSQVASVETRGFPDGSR